MQSTVRKLSGISMIATPPQQEFLLADVHMDWPLGRDEITLFISSEGMMIVAPLPEERFRIIACVGQGPESLSLDHMQSLLEKRGGHRARILELIWGSLFRVEPGVVETFGKGRVLLCGDAAHVFSPVGGQGMNTGIQDATSLVNDLLEALKDRNNIGLVAWAAERRAVAGDIASFTNRMTTAALMKSRTAQTLRNIALGLLGHLPAVRAALATSLAELHTP
jgi:2-polyprenyl-6-methoxyphenol hydroxylase-like FAD-dependent oxidoreductase